MNKMWAVIRIRGTQRLNSRIERTLELLRIKDKNSCVVVPEAPQFKGMLKKAKNFITWGEVDEKTMAELLEKRGKGVKEPQGVLFRLAPPKGGFERKGNLKAFTQGGALGYRGKEINKLLKRMI